MEDKKGSSPVTKELQPPDRQPNQFVSKIRRALSQTLEGVKEGLSSLDVKEKQVPLEEITEGKIAQIVYDTFQRGVKPEEMPALNIKDFLNAMGYIAAFSKDYQDEFPDAYRRSRMALFKLCNQGVFRMQIADEINFYGEGIEYIVNKDALEQYVAERTKNEK